MSTQETHDPSASSADDEKVSLKPPRPKPTPEMRETRFRRIVIAIGLLQFVAIAVLAVLLTWTTAATTRLPPCVVVGEDVTFHLGAPFERETRRVKSVDGLWVEFEDTAGGSSWVNWANVQFCRRP